MNTVLGDGCPECGADDLVDEDVEIYCLDCGAVLDDRPIDQGPEWRPFDGAGESRVGSRFTNTRHDKGVGTQPVSFEGGAKAFRMSREDSRAKFASKRERNRAHGFGEIRRIISALDLDERIREQAGELFSAAHREGFLKGRSIELVAACSVYAACRIDSRPITVSDVREVGRWDPAMHLTQNYNRLNRDLDLPIPPPHPVDFLPRLIDDLDLPDTWAERLRSEARELVIEANEDGVDSGSASGFAAGALDYVATRRGIPVTQDDIGDAADCSNVTVRKNRDRLIEWLEGSG